LTQLALGPKAISAGFRCEAYDHIGSTNAEALSRVRDGECGPIWFATTEQTAGRGRRDRTWIAPRGNLAASILEVMPIQPGIAATLGFAAGVAMINALQQACGSHAADFRLKWPNDLLANGAKLSGILLEAEAAPDGRLAVVVGIGTNVVAAPEGTAYPATSLAALGIDTDAGHLFAALSDAWCDLRAIWDQGRGFAAIRTMWLAHAAGLGERVHVSNGPAVTLDGIFDTIDEQGCLIVRGADGRRTTLAAGDVYFGAAASTKALA